MDAQIIERLDRHMTEEETFQRAVSESLKETAVALATVAARLEAYEENGKRLATGVEKIDGRMDDHERRLSEVERSVSQAATVAKWFFGGGFVAACASAYFLSKLVGTLGEILKELPK